MIHFFKNAGKFFLVFREIMEEPGGKMVSILISIHIISIGEEVDSRNY